VDIKGRNFKMALKPPKKFVCTVRDLIYWLYAQLIANSAGFGENYAFVMSRFKKLKSGEMKWSGKITGHEKWGTVPIFCRGQKEEEMLITGSGKSIPGGG
jgi:hypothetical protein